MNHRWKDDQCIHCGIKRKRKSWKLLMAISEDGFKNYYRYGKNWWYSSDDFKTGTFQRPDCKTERKKIMNDM